VGPPTIDTTTIIGSIAVAAVLLVLWIGASRRRIQSGLRLVWIEQLSGNPRRARAIARLLARRCPRAELPELLVHEARALLWDGEFSRAIALVDSRLHGFGAGPLVVKLQALVFAGRIEEAVALFEAHGPALRALRDAAAEVGATARPTVYRSTSVSTRHSARRFFGPTT
jgi:hypothetical protein